MQPIREQALHSDVANISECIKSRMSDIVRLKKCSNLHLMPTMFHTATVRPERSGPIILYNTPLSQPPAKSGKSSRRAQ